MALLTLLGAAEPLFVELHKKCAFSAKISMLP